MEPDAELPAADPAAGFSAFTTGSALGLLYYGFALAMAVHAVRHRQWLWVVALLAMPGFAFWYFLYEFRANPTVGFELPGAADRRRAATLESQIALSAFDRPDLGRELGEIRLKQNRLPEAERLLDKVLALRPADLDARALYGQTLLRAGRAADAIPHLEQVTRKDPRHNFGYTLMAHAEALAATGRAADAIPAWRKVLEANHYDRAKTQLAELLATAGQTAEARALADAVVRGAPHTSKMNRRRDAVWQKRARRLLRRLP